MQTSSPPSLLHSSRWPFLQTVRIFLIRKKNKQVYSLPVSFYLYLSFWVCCEVRHCKQPVVLLLLISKSDCSDWLYLVVQLVFCVV